MEGALPIPAFSIFSAISELFVTAGVLWIIRRNWTRRPFPVSVLLVVALFEALVNVMYMANRASHVATGRDPLSTPMKLFYAGHGMLSLVAYVAFVILALLAWQEQRAGRWFFREHPGLTWTFVLLWLISIGTGEAIFVLRYLV